MKTSELTGAALDWAVRYAENGKLPFTYNKNRDNFSTCWNKGGPIIEREDISFRKYHNPKSEAHGTYYAQVCRESGTMVHWSTKYPPMAYKGPTPLIAAMRCYVASRLGDEVEIPEELS